ncbi:hypothetical protein BDR04DRAFT_1162433 [Suillus decipiens]|nr:hypothetical protein BDR04DRAFT_1162433 [Suillus decipiens]
MKIQYFQDGLNLSISMKLFATGDIPETFNWVVETCITINNSYYCLQAIKSHHALPKKKNFRNCHYSSFCNPNAIEIDCLSQAEKAEHIKKGKCFLCHQTRHHVNGCPQKKGKDAPVRKTKSKIEEVKSDDKETVRQLAQDF